MFCGPASICSRVTRRERGRVVGHLERAETLETGVLGGERELGAAAATDQRAGGAGRWWRGRRRSTSCEAFLSSFPARDARAGTELAPAARWPRHRVMRGGCRGVIGPFPQPLWMRYSVVPTRLRRACRQVYGPRRAAEPSIPTVAPVTATPSARSPAMPPPHSPLRVT